MLSHALPSYTRNIHIIILPSCHEAGHSLVHREVRTPGEALCRQLDSTAQEHDSTVSSPGMPAVFPWLMPDSLMHHPLLKASILPQCSTMPALCDMIHPIERATCPTMYRNAQAPGLALWQPPIMCFSSTLVFASLCDSPALAVW